MSNPAFYEPHGVPQAPRPHHVGAQPLCRDSPLRPFIVPPDAHCHGDLCLTQPVSLLISNPSATSPFMEHTDSFHVLDLSLWEEGRGRARRTVESSPVTASAVTLTYPDQLPVLQAPSMLNAQYTLSCKNLLRHYFTVPSLYLGTFTHTNTIVRQLPTVLDTAMCCAGL